MLKHHHADEKKGVVVRSGPNKSEMDWARVRGQLAARQGLREEEEGWVQCWCYIGGNGHDYWNEEGVANSSVGPSSSPPCNPI